VLLLFFQGGFFITEWRLNTFAGTIKIFTATGAPVGDLLTLPLLTGV
jgi:hypothetical protein